MWQAAFTRDGPMTMGILWLERRNYENNTGFPGRPQDSGRLYPRFPDWLSLRLILTFTGKPSLNGFRPASVEKSGACAK
jgi:hypothetical protein